ncbi:hypothetical protein KJ673_02675 [Patescibacteria group bacterium]|nr:hypothetical protein [Patescibacteria group bacterium]MCG2687262.1 hypothetical protein [Candidatus Parcubacteria bacterium]
MLSSNINVQRCSDRSVTYTTVFKRKAVELYEQGFTSTEIFKQAGFNLDVISKIKARETLKGWKRIVKKKGIGGLVECRGHNNNSGRPKTKGLSDTDRIERLEIENAYLKAENAFLAKLRAKRRE